MSNIINEYVQRMGYVIDFMRSGTYPSIKLYLYIYKIQCVQRCNII